MAETEEKQPTVKQSIEKILSTFYTHAEARIGQLYTEDKSVMATYWANALMKDSPDITPMQVKESAKRVLEFSVSGLPTYGQFKVLGNVVLENEAVPRKPLTVQEWEKEANS